MALNAERQAEIGARIKELREELHLPQPVVAERVGVTLRAYQKWEQGKGVAWENFVRLVEVLQTSEDYLLSGPAEELPADAETQLDRIEQLLRQNNAMLVSLLGDDPGAAVEAELADAAAETSRKPKRGTAANGRAPRSAAH